VRKQVQTRTENCREQQQGKVPHVEEKSGGTIVEEGCETMDGIDSSRDGMISINHVRILHRNTHDK
jgi:hypothetical protein